MGYETAFGRDAHSRVSINTRLEDFWERQEEIQLTRAQVVEAHREIAASTTNSRQGQYTTTTSGILIRTSGAASKVTR